MNTFMMKRKQILFGKRLENLFARKTSGNKITLIRKLVNLKYKDGNNMVEYISSF